MNVDSKKRVVIISKLSVVLMLLATVFLAYVVSDIKGFSPHSLKQVEAKLNKSLTIDYEYVSTKEKTTENDVVNKRVVYTFKDKNGVEFEVISSYFFSIAPDIFTQIESQCTYVDNLFLASRSDIEEAFSKYLDAGEYRFGADEPDGAQIQGYWIRLSSRDDIPRVANALKGAFDAIPEFPVIAEKYDLIYDGDTGKSTGEFVYSGIPVVGVVDVTDSYVVEWFHFYCEGDDEHDFEQMLLSEIDY